MSCDIDYDCSECHYRDQIDQLARWILENMPEEITNDGAVGVAIKIMSRLAVLKKL